MQSRGTGFTRAWRMATLFGVGVSAWPQISLAQDNQAAPPAAAVKAVQDAIEQLKKDGAGKSAPARPLGDIADYFGPDNYPAAALRALEQGRSVVRVDIDQRGYPIGCTVIETSKSASLDEATCRIARMKMQFAPARDRKGKPIASQFTLPVRWSLPEEGAKVDVTDGRKALVDVTVELALDAEGNITACKVIEQEPKEKDACSGFPIGQSANFYAIKDGAASPSRMTVVHRVWVDQP